MSDALFFRLLETPDKATELAGAVQETRQNVGSPIVYEVRTRDLKAIPGSPFAYWAQDKLRAMFTELPAIQDGRRHARVGLQSSDDFRFYRAWWEVDSFAVFPSEHDVFVAEWYRQSTHAGRKWVPSAKGGKFARMYKDISLVVNWAEDGAEIKRWAGTLYNNSHWSRIIKSEDEYFKAGITWPLRGIVFSAQCLPSGSVFTVAGKALLAEPEELPMLLALANSRPFDFLVRMFAGKVGGVQYESGLIGKIPMPVIPKDERDILSTLALAAVDIQRELDTVVETSHLFFAPIATASGQASLNEASVEWRTRAKAGRDALSRIMSQIDGVTLQLYDLDESDLEMLGTGEGLSDSASSAGLPTDDWEDGDGDTEIADADTPVAVAGPLLSWCVGSVLGRFDVRVSRDRRLLPDLHGPFGPLPASSPGMLLSPDGLPATRNRIVSEEWLRARPNAITLPPEGTVARPTISDSEYPIVVDWDGILVDDPEHDDDVVRRVREVLHVIWGDGADGIEQEACEMLGVKELRDWFRNPRNFWDDHIKRYSKSRRKAPIYWLLQSSKRSFALWIYYHRLDGDMLAKALTTYVEPKVRREETRLAELKAGFEAQQPTGAAARKAERDIERQEALVSELVEFRAAFDRATKLGLQPDLDDGVVLNIAPLHELVPWKVARQYWDELLAGKYEWSTVSKQLRAKGLVR